MTMLQDQATESAISKTYLTTEPFIWGGEKGIGCSLTFHSHQSSKTTGNAGRAGLHVPRTHGLFLNQSNTDFGETERPGFEIFLYHILAVLPLVNLYEIHFLVCKMGTIILTF